jgi:hypothetical protein
MFAYPLTLKGEEAHNGAAGPGGGLVLPLLALHYVTPLSMDHHNMVIHITHTAAYGKGISSRVKLGNKGAKHQVGTAVSQGCRIS